MILQNLITDRAAGSYYNAADLNRVEQAVALLADILRECGYIAAVNLRTEEWTIADFPAETEMNRYLANVRALIDAFCVLPETPPPPESMSGLSHTGANDIERILGDIYLLIRNMTAGANRFCGEFYLGEDGFI